MPEYHWFILRCYKIITILFITQSPFDVFLQVCKLLLLQRVFNVKGFRNSGEKLHYQDEGWGCFPKTSNCHQRPTVWGENIHFYSQKII